MAAYERSNKFMSIRSIEKHIKFNIAEYEVICIRAAKLKMRIGTYLRTIAVQGCIKVFDLKELNDVRLAVNRIGNNLNQISAVANSTNSIYKKDVEDLQNEMKQLRIIFEDWLEPLQSEILL